MVDIPQHGTQSSCVMVECLHVPPVRMVDIPQQLLHYTTIFSIIVYQTLIASQPFPASLDPLQPLRHSSSSTGPSPPATPSFSRASPNTDLSLSSSSLGKESLTSILLYTNTRSNKISSSFKLLSFLPLTRSVMSPNTLSPPLSQIILANCAFIACIFLRLIF